MKIWKQKLIWLKIFQSIEIQLIECNENISCVNVTKIQSLRNFFLKS
jgi:hypothetical protein